jgi:hypothetical protein
VTANAGKSAQGGEQTAAFADVAAQTFAGAALVWAGYAIAHGLR